jgi:hypothetical protein
MPTVFVSSSWRDSEFVTKLCGRLASSGVRVCSDDPESGSRPPSSEGGAGLIDLVDHALVVVSPHSLGSARVRQEALMGLAREQELGRSFVLPLVIADCLPRDLAPGLHSRQFHDFRDPVAFEERLEQLLGAIGVGRSDSSRPVTPDPRRERYDLYPIDNERIIEIPLFGQRYFRIEDCLPLDLLRSWNARDPNGIRVLRSPDGAVQGLFMVFFLRREALDAFASGRMIEREITADHLLSPVDTQDDGEDALYLSSLVCRPLQGSAGTLSTLLMLYLLKYIDLLREHRRIDRLNAIAATEWGEKFLGRRLGFTIRTPAPLRRDGENFYELDITGIPSLFQDMIRRSDAIRSLAASIGDPDSWAPKFPAQP